METIKTILPPNKMSKNKTTEKRKTLRFMVLGFLLLEFSMKRLLGDSPYNYKRYYEIGIFSMVFAPKSTLQPTF